MSIERINPEAINRLDRFWESLLDDADCVDGVEPEGGSTVRRLYALDDVAGPDAAFVRRLEVALVADGRVGGRDAVNGDRLDIGDGRTSPRMGTRSAPTKDVVQGGGGAAWGARWLIRRLRRPMDVAAALLLFVAVGVAGFGVWLLSGSPASQSPVVPDAEDVALYVSAATGGVVHAVDAMTLADVSMRDDPLAGVATPALPGWPSAWLASDDGSTVVRVDYRIDLSTPPSELAVTVLDGRTGTVRTTFVHEGLYRGVYAPPLLSGDGSRLLIPNEYLYVHVGAPRAMRGFAVYDTADGQLVSTIELFGAGDSIETDRFFVSPTGDRLYSFSVINLVTGGPLIGTPSPFEPPGATVETPLLSSYDLEMGRLLDTLELTALVQQRISEQFQMPAAALSPDGGTMAFVQASGSTLTLVDTARMAIARTYVLGDGGRAPTPTPTPNAQQVTDDLFNPPRIVGQAVYSPDGARLFVRWDRADTNVRTTRVQTIDVEQREIVAEAALAHEDVRTAGNPNLDGWIRVSPDGASLYVHGPIQPLGIFGQPRPDQRPWALWRLDAETLAVEAYRGFRGERSVMMWTAT